MLLTLIGPEANKKSLQKVESIGYREKGAKNVIEDATIAIIRERIFRASAIVSIHDSNILVNHLIAMQLHFAKSLISPFLMLSRLTS